MAGSRPSKPATPGSRSLLNLGSGDKSGLEKAFQALIGKIRPKAAPPAAQPAEPDTPEQVLAILFSLGFQAAGPDKPALLTHPLAPERRVNCPASASATPDLEAWALDWAVRHFPEIEFYLPYISRRAVRARRSTGRPTTPEPEYDDDGFLAEYP